MSGIALSPMQVGPMASSGLRERVPPLRRTSGTKSARLCLRCQTGPAPAKPGGVGENTGAPELEVERCDRQMPGWLNRARACFSDAIRPRAGATAALPVPTALCPELSFDRWTALSDTYARKLARWKHGDASVRDEVTQLGHQLQALSKAMYGDGAQRATLGHHEFLTI